MWASAIPARLPLTLRSVDASRGLRLQMGMENTATLQAPTPHPREQDEEKGVQAAAWLDWKRG